MPEYYLDIETNAKGQRPDIKSDEILTIQFQRLSSRSGRKESDLTILKSWESSEKAIIKKFYNIFQPSKPFEFIPIGMNLSFEFFMLHNRWKRIGIEVPLKTLIYAHPSIDIQPILVILNEGSFKGASLGKFTGKKHTGSEVPGWYAEGDYNEIEKYIRDEAEGFILFYQELKRKIPRIL
jgi:hypothetical protein